MTTSRCLWFVICLSSFVVDCRVLEKLFENAEPCEAACEKTYSLHTYPTAEHLECCQRGCRLFTMIDIINDFQKINDTRDSCMASCMEAYTKTAERYACNIGCSNQVSAAQQRCQQEHKQTLHLLKPLMYIQAAYNSIANHVTHFVTTTWALYVQQDDGKLVIIQSQPRVQELPESDEGDSQEAEFPDDAFEQSEFHSLEQHRYPPEYLRPSSRYHFTLGDADRHGTGVSSSMDWLGCISRQSGLPRWMLVVSLFFGIMVLVWLCCATTVTAPTQRIRQQKLSIDDDLTYLLEYDPSEKIHIQPPRDDNAAPLPVKIPLDRI